MPHKLEDWASPISGDPSESQLKANEPVNSAKMPSYIGTKVVCATPMTELAFQQTYKNKGLVSSVDREDAPGYLVVYEDGYKSWSPQSTFERAYRKITEAEKHLIY